MTTNWRAPTPPVTHPQSKRYQEVEELLAHGLDSYSTLNIKHLESLNDVVSQITNVVVRRQSPNGYWMK